MFLELFSSKRIVKHTEPIPGVTATWNHHGNLLSLQFDGKVDPYVLAAVLDLSWPARHWLVEQMEAMGTTI